jgi:hypothetical protein
VILRHQSGPQLRSVLRVVYREQLRLSDLGHRIRDRSVKAGIHSRTGPKVPIVNGKGFAHLLRRRS